MAFKDLSKEEKKIVRERIDNLVEDFLDDLKRTFPEITYFSCSFFKRTEEELANGFEDDYSAYQFGLNFDKSVLYTDTSIGEEPFFEITEKEVKAAETALARNEEE